VRLRRPGRARVPRWSRRSRSAWTPRSSRCLRPGWRRIRARHLHVRVFEQGLRDSQPESTCVTSSSRCARARFRGSASHRLGSVRTRTGRRTLA
jgi:hypothetical protein